MFTIKRVDHFGCNDFRFRWIAMFLLGLAHVPLCVLPLTRKKVFFSFLGVGGPHDNEDVQVLQNYSTSGKSNTNIVMTRQNLVYIPKIYTYFSPGLTTAGVL